MLRSLPNPSNLNCPSIFLITIKKKKVCTTSALWINFCIKITIFELKNKIIIFVLDQTHNRISWTFKSALKQFCSLSCIIFSNYQTDQIDGKGITSSRPVSQYACPNLVQSMWRTITRVAALCEHWGHSLVLMYASVGSLLTKELHSQPVTVTNLAWHQADLQYPLP